MESADRRGVAAIAPLRTLACSAGSVLLGLVVATAAAAEIVARVNGAPITDDSVNAVVKSVLVERGGAPSSEEIAQLNDAALDSLIDLELLYQAAVKQQIAVSDQDVQAEIARSKARVGGEKAFAVALERSGLTQQQLVAETRKTLIVERLVDSLPAGTPVTADAARRFYDEHQQEFRHGDELHLRELVVPVDATAPAADRDKARRLADELHNQLRGGAAFAQFAKTYPADAASAAHGGDRGFVAVEALPPAVATAALALPVGQLSEVIDTPTGFHLVQVIERRPAGVTSFEEARATVEQALREADRRQRQQAYIAELRRTANIERPTPVAKPAGE